MTIDDAIERLRWFRKNYNNSAPAFDLAIAALEAEIERQTTGGWIPVTHSRGGHECSECHEYAPSYADGDEHLTPYCPHCGCKMAKPEQPKAQQ